MALSKQAQESIKLFAKEQASKHLDNAEMSYFESLSQKSGEVKKKLAKQMEKFKRTSKQTLEAREDLETYMSDYVNDLMSQGYQEEEAMELAKKALAADSDSDLAANLQDKYKTYYLTRSPEMEETIGLFYAGFMFVGMAIGAVVGILIGAFVFTAHFFASVAIGTGLGLIFGLGCGMLKHGSIVNKSSANDRY
ncbi:hypothetical protein [Shouchella rhizosphaerae]|uniref:DUF1269 domain-containing protein n=1 Tax=Shouchella rhizosphaerae TaxID=866786 RepID=A0ABZ2CW76_9BACI